MLRALLLAGIAGWAYKKVTDGRLRRRFEPPAAAPAPVQRWEGEGGGVPVGGGQTAASRVHHDDLLGGGEPMPRGMP